MNTNPSLSSSFLLTAFFVGIIWCIKSAEFMFSIDLGWLGVYPGQWSSIPKIFTAPMVHGSLEHIFNNTLPMLILGTVLLYGYPKTRWRVIALVWVLSGLGVLLFAREASHIGASGLTHGVFFYLFISSIFRRDKSSIAIMMIAFFLYGGMTMTIFPREPGISFEYHFFGAVAGTLAAVLWHKLDPKPVEKKYDWEEEDYEDDYDTVIGEQWHEEQQEGRSELDNPPRFH